MFLTIDSDLAVTIRVTGCKKLLGLSVSQSSGRGREVLQEQPGENNQREILINTANMSLKVRVHLLENLQNLTYIIHCL